MINHCDRRITLPGGTDIIFGLFNLFTSFDNIHLVKNHPSNIPAKVALKWLSVFRSNNFPTRAYVKFVLCWWPS
jgi:hypothetical protein